MKAKQSDIFDGVAKEVVHSALDGYNGTIFAYGQTGSGKTYTITGQPEKLEKRGIIPRTLTYIFNEIRNRPLYKWTIYISYLEIYNNDGYDLLHQNQNAKLLEELPKVIIRENTNKQFLLYNLSIHKVENEEDALYLLMMGDDNRVVAETPKNDASTRSHCIFMIQIESQKEGEDVKTLSKLHIVDLSGSESNNLLNLEPYKTDLNGVRMEEALNINLSLHFLEQVIVSLNRKEGHIPYRNSMMTMCLRDSLGGNCKTRMIATLSAEFEDVMESMSTCRFAQRVALVKNIAVKNEIEDHNIIIQKQKYEIEELKSELAIIKGKEQKTVLDKEDIEKCRKIAEEYLSDDDYKKRINLKDMLMIQECFAQMKKMYKDLEKKVNSLNPQVNNEVVLKDNVNSERIIELENSIKKLNSEIENCKDIIKKRDEESRVLLSTIDKYRANELEYKPLLNRLNEEDIRLSQIRNDVLGNVINFNDNISSISKKDLLNNLKDNTISLLGTNKQNESHINISQEIGSIPLSILRDLNTANSILTSEIPVTQELLMNKDLLNIYKKYHTKTSNNENNIELLKVNFDKGKALSTEVININEQIVKTKTSVSIKFKFR
jgi:kinesin family protein 6/9